MNSNSLADFFFNWQARFSAGDLALPAGAIDAANGDAVGC